MKKVDQDKIKTEEESKATIPRTSHKLLYIVILFFLLSLTWFLFVIWYKVVPHQAQKVHYHAGFIVVEDGKLVDFSKPKFMSFTPCVVASAKEEETSEQMQIEKAHLHDEIGDVIHVEEDDAKWGDLFTNLHYPINYSETEAFINGKKVPNIQNMPIKHYQSAVIFIGNNQDTQKFLNQAVTEQHMIETAAKSRDCGSH
jgi:hypothetical protein